MKSGQTKNGTKFNIWDDGYIAAVTRSGVFYSGYIVNGKAESRSVMERKVLDDCYKEYLRVKAEEALPPFFAGMKDEADKFVNEALAFCNRQRQHQNQLHHDMD